jgi:hypothetical protein
MSDPQTHQSCTSKTEDIWFTSAHARATADLLLAYFFFKCARIIFRISSSDLGQ